MEKSNIHLIIETKEKKWGKGNMYIFMNKMTKNYPVQSYEYPPPKKEERKMEGKEESMGQTRHSVTL